MTLNEWAYFPILAGTFQFPQRGVIASCSVHVKFRDISQFRLDLTPRLDVSLIFFFHEQWLQKMRHSTATRSHLPNDWNVDTCVTSVVWFYERLTKLTVVIVFAKDALKVYLNRKLSFILARFDQHIWVDFGMHLWAYIFSCVSMQYFHRWTVSMNHLNKLSAYTFDLIIFSNIYKHACCNVFVGVLTGAPKIHVIMSSRWKKFTQIKFANVKLWNWSASVPTVDAKRKYVWKTLKWVHATLRTDCLFLKKIPLEVAPSRVLMHR